MPFDFLPQLPVALNTLALFGLLLACGAIGGYIAHRFEWLPSITGFMLVGFSMGPSGLSLISATTLAESRALVDIALGLILYRLGLSLDVRAVLRSRFLLAASALESTLTAVGAWGVLTLLGVPSLTAALIGAIVISSSPAVLIHVSHELKARGPVTESAGALVAMNNVIAFLVFIAVLPALFAAEHAPWQNTVFSPLYRLFGSLLLAIVIGVVLHRMARLSKQARQYRLALVIGAVMLALGLAKMLHLSILLAPLALGIVVRNLEKKALIADVEFGEAFELFFIVLFVFAGANLHVHELIKYAPLALALVAVRSLAKWGGVFGAGVACGLPPQQSRATGLLLIPMAGLAIGLVNTTESMFPQAAAMVSAIVLAAVAIFETIGPPIAALAFRIAGEVGLASDEST
ncbi:MAG: cation:proton antiporter [Burkholderiales bacterium]